MNHCVKYCLLLFSLFTTIDVSAQTDTYLNGGLYIVGDSEVYIKGDLINRTGGSVFFDDNGKLYVEGDITNNNAGNNLFINSLGEVILNGTSDQYINGSSNSEFYHITINKLSGQLILDGHDLIINSQLEFSSGRLFLNTHNIDLGSTGTIVNESDSHYIYGFPGSIMATNRFLNSPSINDNIAGMGLYLGSSAGYGSTSITRYHKVQESPGNGSIAMYFHFEPQFENTTLSDQVAIGYFDHQVNGLDESIFSVWKSLNNGVTWEKYEGNANTAANLVTGDDVTEISTSTYFTVAEKDCLTDPNVQVGAAIQSFCTGESLTLDAGASGLIYKWYKNGVLLSSETSELLTVNEPGTYRVYGVNSNGCDAEDEVVVFEKALPVADFSGSPACVEQTINFNNNSSSIDGTLTYEWDFGDGTTSTGFEPSHFYTVAGTYDVTLTIRSTFGCEDVIQKPIIISPLPTADFQATTICFGDVTSFTDLSGVPSGSVISTYLWDFGDGSTSSEPSPEHNYSAAGSYNVTLSIVTNAGCSDVMTHEVIVNEEPVAAFSFESICSTNVIAFTNETVISDLQGYSWDFGNGETSIFENPTITFTTSGTYTVRLIAESVYGCIDQFSADVTVTEPEPLFPEEVETCGSSFTLDADPDNLYAGSTFLWSTTETTSVITATSNGVYTVTITEPNGCETTGSTYVRINEFVSIDLPDNINGCDSEQLDAGYFSGASYSWSTGESGQRITVNQSGSYTISIEDNNGCVASKTIDVVINPSLEVNLGDDQYLCAGGATVLDAGNANMNYLWSTGATTQTITVDTANEYWVDVTDPLTGCTTRDVIYVFIYSDYELDLGADRITCPGSPVTLSAPIDDVTYAWSNSSGVLGTDKSFTVNEPGKYWLTVTNADGCQAADTINIEESLDTITADFLASSLVDEGDTIQFINLSYPNPISYVWNFGDGTTSTDEEPRKIYLTEGSYEVSLSASNGTCTNTLTKVITVRPLREDVVDGDVPMAYPELVDYKVYPNPVDDVLYLDIETNRETLIYCDLVDLNGRVLRWGEYTTQQVSDKFNVTSLKSGMYILRIKVAKEVKLLRIMKR